MGAHKTQSLLISWRLIQTNTKRLTAAFFALIMLASVALPPATIFAEGHRPDPSNANTAPKNKKDPNTSMKQAYPAGMQPTIAEEKAASDTKAATDTLVEKFTKTPGAGEVLTGTPENVKNTQHELTEKRTATSSVTVNEDGTITEKQFFAPVHFKTGDKWEVIDTSLIEDKNASDSSNIFGRGWGAVRSWFSEETTFKIKDNDWQVRFAPSNAGQGLLRVQKDGDQISFAPVNAKENVNPSVVTKDNGDQAVYYYDLWPGVDVEYIVESNAVKENIIIKDRNAANQVSFRVTGAELEKKKETQTFGNHEVTTEAYVLKGALNDEFAITPANLILNNYGFVSDQSVFGQTVHGNTVTLSVDKNYLQSLPDKAFPAVIDPSTFHGTFGTRAGGNYVSFKSDGYVCPSTVCNPYAGSLYDRNNVLRYWRSAVYAPYSQLNDPNKTLSNATLHLKQRSNESFWTGTGETHNYQVGHATCLNNFNCLNGGVFNAQGSLASSGNIDVTNIYQYRMSQGDYGAWLMLGGEDGTTSSFKNFDPGTGAFDSGSYVSFTFNGPPPAPSVKSPIQNQVYVDPQPSFSVTAVTNPNGGTPLQYQMRISSAPGGTGTLIASPVQASTQWTAPDNMLQDGSTYYLQARSYDPISGLFSDWGTSVPFRIDMRTGMDKTQTYDTLGPINVDLATGNLATSTASHSSTALGGGLGVTLNYNTPLKSRNGLVGQYWNNQSLSGDPVVTRVDQAVDFNWDLGSPSTDTIGNDHYSARWSGYFVAPETGDYQFGSTHDDDISVVINNQTVYSGNCCSSGPSGAPTYGQTVSLTAGQIVPIVAEYKENDSPAYVRLFVKGAVNEQVIPNEWLQTGVRPVNYKKHGLTGSYFARLDGTNTFSANNHKIMERVDPYLSFNWGGGAPVANGPNDFLVRWSGYITVPASGTYTLGSRSDDGSKITLGTNNTVVLDDWTNHATPASPAWGSNTYALTANTPTPITIEYYDQGGDAAYELWIKSAGAGIAEQITPGDWLSPKAQVLPDGWDLGVDGSGTANYSHLKPNQNSVLLTDSSGSTHEYTWTGSGYTPPVNENGYLVRNADGTFMLQDADGQTYVFAVDGNLTSVTSSVDDRNPAALQYEYQSLNGGPAHLYKIKDGVDPTRNATLYYSGQSECGSAPGGFDANAPAGMLCAVQTNDGRVTHFYYVQGQLARISGAANAMIDYQYETVTNSGGAPVGYRLNGIRGSLANDAIAAGVRNNDNEAKTQIDYDILGRVVSVTSPAPQPNEARLQHTIEYLPGAKAYVDANGSPVAGYAGMTKRHVTGASQPQGYTQRVKYDHLFRTIEATDNTGLSTTTEWDQNKDIVYSITDASGLKTTTVYDDEDRPVSSYGPAPKAWFATGAPNNQTPLAEHADQIPRADASYDQGIVGPAVSWHDYTKLSGNTAGALTGSPKLHTTGIESAHPGVLSSTFANPPITPSGNAQGIGFSATGKLRPPNGTYTISADTSDGIRAWVDDQLVLDQWVDSAHRTVTGTSFAVTNSSPKRIQIEVYRRTGSTGTLNITLAQNGGFGATTDWSHYLKPGYGLTTGTKTYDSTFGDSVSAVNYGNTPELGLPQSVTSDPAGLALTSTSAHEQQGASNSYLRPTTSSRPGDLTNNPAATYAYYGATETRDNPCTPATESYKQAGMLKSITDASPDGGTTPGRTTETVYDDAGKTIATRTNNDGWTCTTYDARGRVAQTDIPAVGSEAGRTITNNYAVWGDPTITGAEDASGSTATQIDLLGQTIYYHDAQWNETWTNYDNLGRLDSRTSDLGHETFVYDTYNRLIQQKLDATTYAVVTYDQFSRVQQVEYPNANGQKMAPSYDALGRLQGKTYYQGGGQTPGGNLVGNASVEQVSSGSPDEPEGWQPDSWGTNSAAFTYLNEGYTGNRSVKAEITAHTDGDAKWYFDAVPVTGNTTYTFKDYYRSNVTSGVVMEYTHQNNSVTYEWIGDLNPNDNWTQANLNFTTPATATHATALHLISSVGWLIVDDAEIYQPFQSGDPSVIASDMVTRSQSGRVAQNIVTAGSKELWYSYDYDAVGRLTSADIGPNTYTYGYGAQDSSCAAGTNQHAGKNFNRTSQTVNGVSTTYCYDYADRLISSSDPLANTVQYDGHGNITQIGSGSAPLVLGYDASDRNWGYSQHDANGDGNGVYYGRDVHGRITYRETDTISAWDWTVTGNWWYGFTGPGSGPSFTRNANWDITEKYLALPGGVNLAIKPQESGDNQKQYNLSNIHGDVLLTTNAAGVNTSTGNGPANAFTYDPFGNILPGSTFPGNFAEGSYAWAGKHQKITETTLTLIPIQMGARVYFPTLGRFGQIDPVRGGTANDYVYAHDPVNMSDYSGMFSITSLIKSAVNAVVGVIQNKSQSKATSSPSAAGGYIQWLIGAGQTLVMKAASIVWLPAGNEDKKILSQKTGVSQTVPISASAQGFQSSEHIGRVSGTFNGNITKTNNGYTAKGMFTPVTDVYDFNMGGGRGFFGEAATAFGASGGIFANRASFGIIKPTSYYIEFEGSAEVEWSW